MSLSAPLYLDRVQETSVTTGIGTYTLAGALTGFQAFSAIGDGNQCYYLAAAVDGAGVPSGAWEVGLGTYTLAGTLLARTQILSSSNAGAAVNWGAGTKRLSVVLAAEKIPRTATVTLTNAQLLTLVATPVTIIPAPGSGRRIKLLGVTLNVNTLAGVYGTIDTTSANLVVQVIGGWWLSAPIANDSAYGLTQLTDLLTNAQQRVVDLILPAQFTMNKTSTQLDGYVTYLDPVAGLPAPSDVDNAVIELGATNNGAGNWSLGHVDNTLKVTSTYLIEPV